MSLKPHHEHDAKDGRLGADVDAVVGAEGYDQAVPASKAFPDQHHESLSVPQRGGIRAASPDTLSIISVEEYPPFRGPAPGYCAVPELQDPSPSPTPPSTWQGRLTAFWGRNRGVGLVLASQFFSTLMNVTTRIMEVEGNHGEGYHPFQVLFDRMSITLALSGFYCWWKKIEHFPFGAKEVRWLLVLRGFGGFFGSFGMYYALQYLPLADATVITFLAPSIACFACSILIHEPFTRTEQIAALVSFLGVVLIARPTSLFSSSSPSPPPASGIPESAIISSTNATNTTNAITTLINPSYDNVTPSQRLTAVLFALLGVLGAASAYTTLRILGPRAHALISVNYLAAWTTLVSLTCIVLSPSIPFLLPSTPRDWLYLAFLGVCGFFMQFLLAAGLQAERGGRANNMVYVQMLFAAGFDRWVFGTRMGALSLIGSALILGSAIYVAVGKQRGKVGDGAGAAQGRRDEEVGLAEAMRGDAEGEVDDREARGYNGEEAGSSETHGAEHTGYTGAETK